MATVLLIRHCQAEGQAPDAQLTPLGMEQATQLSAFLEDEKIDLIVTSPYERALKTLEAFANRNQIRMIVDERLQERSLTKRYLSDWQDHLKQSFLDLDYRLYDGESSRAAMERGIVCLKEYLNTRNKTIAFVTHGNLLTLMLKHFDQRFGFLDWANLTNPDVFRLTFDDQEYVRHSRVWDSFKS